MTLCYDLHIILDLDIFFLPEFVLIDDSDKLVLVLVKDLILFHQLVLYECHKLLIPDESLGNLQRRSMLDLAFVRIA